MQFPFMENAGAKNKEADRHRSENNQPLRNDDRVLFDAILKVAKERGTRIAIGDKEQWLIKLGYSDMMGITGRSRSSVRRLIRRLIAHGYIKIECEAKGGTEATIYRIVAPAKCPKSTSAESLDQRS